MDVPKMRKVLFLRFHYVVGKSALFCGSKCSTKGKAEERRFEDKHMRFLTPSVRAIRIEIARNKGIR